MEPHYYSVNVSWNGERKGMMCSPELQSGQLQNGCIEVATPPEFPKGIAGIWSPEHLFTASVASCFMTTFLAVAENSKLSFHAFQCRSKGKLEEVNGRLVMNEVQLFPTVTVFKDEDRDRAIRVMNKAEQACLITNSVKARVTLQPSVELATELVKP
jgi:peroxiredoxin-like protein